MTIFRAILILPVLILGLCPAALAAQEQEESPAPLENVWTDKEHPLVVELFTSSNCLACLGAEKILYDVAGQDNVIALGCHVDYWDEYSASDPTGLEECTYRQWAFSTAGMRETIVRLPHFTLNGERDLHNPTQQGFLTGADIMKSALHKPLLIYMEWKDRDTILIHLPESDRDIADDDSFSVWMIRYKDQMVSKVDQGETAGRVLRFTNIVQGSQHAGKWHGKTRTIEFDATDLPPAEKTERGGYVALVQEMNGDSILAAGKLPDYDPAAFQP